MMLPNQCLIASEQTKCQTRQKPQKAPFVAWSVVGGLSLASVSVPYFENAAVPIGFGEWAIFPAPGEPIDAAPKSTQGGSLIIFTSVKNWQPTEDIDPALRIISEPQVLGTENPTARLMVSA